MQSEGLENMLSMDRWRQSMIRCLIDGPSVGVVDWSRVFDKLSLFELLLI